MTYGDDRTAGAMSDDERQEYIRRSGEAMTAGQGGAAELPLRDQIAEAILEVAEIEHDYDDFGPISRVGNEMELADAILAEIAAAGFRIVPADRVAVSKAWLDEHPWVADQLPQPGDLDPVGPGEGGR